MARSLVAAAIQLTAHSRTSFRSVWPRIAQRIEAAAAAGARLIVLPEGTLPSYVLGYEAFQPAEIEAALQQCSALAKRHNAVVVAGAARQQDGYVYNSAIVIDADGTLAGSADKHFLWHFDRQWFAPGERLAPVQTHVGSIGAFVCADGRIPTIARTLVDRGAEVLVMPTAWVTSGRDAANLENAQADLLARVRARENGVPFIAANKCGVELTCVAYCGKSQIIAADGAVAAVASQDTEETLICEIALGSSAPMRTEKHETTRPLTFEPIGSPVRVAITARSRKSDDANLLQILEADVLLYARDRLERSGVVYFPCTHVDDESLSDPGALVEDRLAGHQVALWRTSMDPLWQVTFAQARALELRMYVIAIDEARNRAYAVDPDGAVVCGTFGEYEIASFTFDPAKTRQTVVAPGTDVLLGLKRVQTHALR
jgi:predicted amidohydrolase